MTTSFRLDAARPSRALRVAARFATRSAAVAAFALAGLAPDSAQAANIALGRAVLTSGPTWPGFAGYNMTDGNPNTIVHPAEAVTSYSYLIDLGQTSDISRIDV